MILSWDAVSAADMPVPLSISAGKDPDVFFAARARILRRGCLPSVVVFGKAAFSFNKNVRLQF
jgi:hypothetical protein